MTLNEYQQKAMRTSTESSSNFAYMTYGLGAEVGEFMDKVAKWVRKNEARIEHNGIVFNTCEEDERDNNLVEIKKELGDCLWFIAGIADVMGWSLEDVAESNIAKLADRQKRGVIIGNGDNR